VRRVVPYPLLTIGLALVWLLLSGFTRGQFVLAVLVSVSAAHALHALGEVSPNIHRWLAIPQFLGIVAHDVAISNITVATALLFDRRDRLSGFVTVPLRLKNPSALAILAIVLTSTPGTAWIDYNAARGELLIHIFDLVDDDYWPDVIANRYEKLLMEIFG
jgi:multicomponent K+:H+ antiporter subunit E